MGNITAVNANESDLIKEEKKITFEDMHLQVGTRLQLITLGQQKREYYSTLIGYEPHQYLLIKMPQENGFNIPLSVTQRIEIRVFTGMSIFKFPSSVEYIYHTPRQLIELTFPDQIQAMPLREDFRIALKAPAKIWKINKEKQQTPISALILDVSITGAMLQCSAYCGEPGDELGIIFPIRNTITKEDMPIRVMTTIRNAKEEKNTQGQSQYRYGLSFHELRPFHQTTLQNLINEHMLHGRKKPL